MRTKHNTKRLRKRRFRGGCQTLCDIFLGNVIKSNMGRKQFQRPTFLVFVLWLWSSMKITNSEIF